VISNTRRSGCGYDQRIEAYGSNGLATAGNPARDTVQAWNDDGSSGAPIAPGFAVRYADAYRLQLDHFVDVARGHSASRATFADGVTALALADACDRSARENRVVHSREFTS
jgi:myo-inositol 2-dehydrogenase / D-chiro-inositol 1-dehydrogenase